MILSRCCKKPVYVYNGQDGTLFYACYGCETSCDTIALWNKHKELNDDTGCQTKVETIASQS